MARFEKQAIGEEEYQETERTKRFLGIILLVLGFLWIGSLVSMVISLVFGLFHRKEATS